MFRKLMFAVLFFILLSLLVMPVAAQELTDEPPVVVVIDQPPLEEATPIVDDEPPVVVVPQLPSPETIQLTWGALAGIIAIVLSVGLTGGFAGAVAIIRAIRANDNVKFAMEKLYLSTPAPFQERTRKVVELADEATELAKELTDGVLPDATNTA